MCQTFFTVKVGVGWTIPFPLRVMMARLIGSIDALV